jgi:hypothetical protein
MNPVISIDNQVIVDPDRPAMSPGYILHPTSTISAEI